MVFDSNKPMRSLMKTSVVGGVVINSPFTHLRPCKGVEHSIHIDPNRWVRKTRRFNQPDPPKQFPQRWRVLVKEMSLGFIVPTYKCKTTRA